MDESESIYLDLVRFTAALAVVANHFLHNNVLHPALAARMPDFGREAVMVFFVLSGYVITYSTTTRNTTLRDYFVARATRIYSVALPVLLLAFCVDSIAIQFNPEHYHHLYQYEKFYLYLPLHLGFFGEVWFLAERPFTIPPYWSLSYEVWYYVLFAVAFFYEGRRRVMLLLGVGLIVGYQHLLLLPVWLGGVVLFRVRDRWRLPVRLARIGFGLSLAGFVALKVSGLDEQLWQLGRRLWPFPNLPQGSADQFLLDYVVCVMCLINFYCARHAALDAIKRVALPIRTLASYTFTLYLIHTLVIFTWIRNFPYDRSSLIQFSLLCVAIAITTFVVGILTEQRRDLFRALIEPVARAMERAILARPRLASRLRPNRAADI